jgi:predicted alpha/beta hydrolase
MYALRNRLTRLAAAPRSAAAVERGERFTLHSGGVPLAATLFRAPSAERAVVIAPATGVPQGLYRAFAVWMAQQGVNTYTFDFRGVAASRPDRLRGFAADFSDWAEDSNTLIAHALQRHSTVSLIGHSIGGLLAPAADLATRLHRLVLVGAQTALWRDWPARQRLPMLLLWHGLMPAVTAAVGYFPGRKLRLGEDLPRGVAMQWASRPWRDPFMSMQSGTTLQRYARSLPPVHMAAASDDPFATPAAQDRVAQRLSGTRVSRHTWHPHSLGLHKLGHFDVFRPGASPLWPQMLGWISEG